MCIKGKKGSAVVEIIPATAFIALFIVICTQFSALFTEAVHDTAVAEAKVSKMTLDFETSRASEGFRRPCIEDIAPRSVSYGGRPVVIGFGQWKREIAVPQEVTIVREPVCIPW